MEKGLDKLCKDIVSYYENEKNCDYSLNATNYAKMKSVCEEFTSLGFKVELSLEPKWMHAFIDLVIESGVANFSNEEKARFLSALTMTDGVAFYVYEKDKISISTKINDIYERKQ